MAAPGALTDREVVAVRAESAADRPVTVWFTAAAVGVPAGGSAKVVSVADTDEGDFIQVRPAGSRDTLFCSPNELTRTRPARRRAAPGAGSTTAVSTTRVPTTQPASASHGKSTGRPAEKPAPEPAAAAVTQVAARPAPDRHAPSSAAAGPARAARPRRRTDGSDGMSITLAATPDGDWTVEVLAGRKRVVPATPVAAADVVTVARSLPTAVAEAIESSLEGARQRQRERVERLRAELDVAQRVLDQLGV